MSIDIDITNDVEFSGVDDELLPITQCKCGQKFHSWTFMISIYRDSPYICPNCERKLYFKNQIRVYEIVADEH